jgi:hypothetical protein
MLTHLGGRSTSESSGAAWLADTRISLVRDEDKDELAIREKSAWSKKVLKGSGGCGQLRYRMHESVLT